MRPTTVEPTGRSLVVAAIDVGTNLVRMRVERLGGHGQTVLGGDGEITRLGAGQRLGGPLTEEAMARTVAVLGRLVNQARALGAEEIRLVATSAVREATNREAFQSRVRELMGVEVEVIDGAGEASLDALGAIADLGYDVGDAVLVDIGGGSTELVRIVGGRAAAAASVPVGVVRLTEAHLRHDPPTGEELEILESAARGALAELAQTVRGVSEGGELIANAGTATTLAAIDLGLRELDPERIRGHRLDRGTVDRIYDQLAGMPAERRLEVPGVVRGREDLIVAGLALLRATLSLTRAATVRVSAGGLLEGLLVERSLALQEEEAPC